MSDYLSRKICTTGPALVDYHITKSDDDQTKVERFLKQKEYAIAVLWMYQSMENLIKALYVNEGNHKAPPLLSLKKGIEKIELQLAAPEYAIISQLDEFNQHKNDSEYKSKIDVNWIQDIYSQYKDLRLKFLDSMT